MEHFARLIALEPVAVGEQQTRASTLVFLLLLFIPIFGCLLFGAVDTGTWVMLAILFGMMSALWLLDALTAGGLVFYLSSLLIPLFGLLALGMIQLLPSPVRSLDPYATRLFVVRLAIYILFTLAVLTFINTEKRIRAAAFTVIIFGACLAFFSILQRLADPGAIYGIRETPQAISFGPFVNQHHFAAFMIMIGPLVLGQIVSKGVDRGRKLMLGIMLLIVGSAVAFTSSRGGMIGFCVAIVMTIAVTASNGGKADRNSGVRGTFERIAIPLGMLAVMLLLIFGVVLLLGGDSSLMRYANMGSSTADITNGRSHFWPIAWRIFLDHPLAGSGLDSFGMAFTRYDTLDGTFRIEQAHNEYLQSLSDGGIAGFILVAGFIVILVRKSFAAINTAVTEIRRSVAIGAFAGCIGILIHSFFDFPLRTPSNAFFFLLLAGLATIVVRNDQRTVTVISKVPQGNANLI